MHLYPNDLDRLHPSVSSSFSFFFHRSVSCVALNMSSQTPNHCKPFRVLPLPVPRKVTSYQAFLSPPLGPSYKFQTSHISHLDCHPQSTLQDLQVYVAYDPKQGAFVMSDTKLCVFWLFFDTLCCIIIIIELTNKLSWVKNKECNLRILVNIWTPYNLRILLALLSIDDWRETLTMRANQIIGWKSRKIWH
jgi:hypothetical protein